MVNRSYSYKSDSFTDNLRRKQFENKIEALTNEIMIIEQERTRLSAENNRLSEENNNLKTEVNKIHSRYDILDLE